MYFTFSVYFENDLLAVQVTQVARQIFSSKKIILWYTWRFVWIIIPTTQIILLEAETIA